MSVSPDTSLQEPRGEPGIGPRVLGMVVQRRDVRGSLDPFYVEFVRGMETVLLESGYTLMVQIRRSVEEEIECYRKWSRSRAVSGVLLVDLQGDDERPGILRGLGLPAVILGNPAAGEDLPSVRTDDFSAMCSAVEHLAALGHRQIAHIGGPAQLIHTRERDVAFFDTARRNGMFGQVLHADYTEAGGARETDALLAQPRGNQPTAIIYDNDLMALGGSRQLMQAGRAIPGDVSILAWDDSLKCQVHGISALSRDLSSYGALAAHTLLQTIGGTATGHYSAEVPHLVVRGSIAPPPQDQTTDDDGGPP